MTFDTAAVQLKVGDTLQTLPKYRRIDGESIPETFETSYTSSHPEVATAVAKGASYELVVTAIGPGTTTITATCCNNVHATIAVTVQAPAWKLDSITGAAGGTWQDVAASGSGTLDFVVPTTVTEGLSYPVSSTFTGSLTVNAGWNGYSTSATISILDRGISSLHVVNNRSTGPLSVGTSAQIITVSGTWVIPSNQTTLSLEAGGGLTLAGTTPNRVARYSKVP